MGEHDTVAGLATQVAELRTTVNTWTARLDQVAGGTLMTRLGIKKLREWIERLATDLAAALDAGTLKARPRPAGTACTPTRPASSMGCATGPQASSPSSTPGTSELPPCWPRHREALWELGNLRAEWRRIYENPAGADLAAAMWWHERWLPGVLARLKNSMPCDEAQCTLQSRSQRDAIVRRAWDCADPMTRTGLLPPCVVTARRGHRSGQSARAGNPPSYTVVSSVDEFVTKVKNNHADAKLLGLVTLLHGLRLARQDRQADLRRDPRQGRRWRATRSPVGDG